MGTMNTLIFALAALFLVNVALADNHDDYDKLLKKIKKVKKSTKANEKTAAEARAHLNEKRAIATLIKQHPACSPIHTEGGLGTKLPCITFTDAVVL